MSAIPQVKKSDVEVLVWLVRLVGHTDKFSKTTFEASYGRELDIPAISMPIARSLKT